MECLPDYEVDEMPQLNTESLSPALRSKYIGIGRQFGSDRTLAQGVESFNAATLHAQALSSHGFSLAKTKRIGWAVEALRLSGGEREQSRLAAGIGTDERHAASAAGKEARRQANNQFALSIDELEFAGHEKVAREVERVMQQTRSSGPDLSLLDRQLETLIGAFKWEAVQRVTADTGGPQAVEALENARRMLVPVLDRGRTHAGNTPVETERLDLLDGIIVDLCRQARKAARTAGKALAQPAMAGAFELDILYGRKKPKSADAPEEKQAEAV